MEMGLVPIFVDFLNNNNNPKLQFEAAWVLTNICSGNSDQVREEKEKKRKREKKERRERWNPGSSPSFSFFLGIFIYIFFFF